LALLLDVDVQPPSPAFRMELVAAPERSPKTAARLPQALEFLAWMIAGEGKLVLPCENGSWTFQRLVH
jgi:hypothetical protein